MLLLALASAAAASAAQPADVAPRRSVVVQARASVRILSGERIRFDGSLDSDEEAPRRRRDTVLVIDGQPVAASIVEFE